MQNDRHIFNFAFSSLDVVTRTRIHDFDLIVIVFFTETEVERFCLRRQKLSFTSSKRKVQNLYFDYTSFRSMYSNLAKNMAVRAVW